MACLNFAFVLTLIGAAGAQQSYAGNGSSCGGPLPATIRVEAAPDQYYVPGSPDSGFLVDLLNAIQAITSIPFTIKARSDLGFGNQNSDGSFTGSFVGELVANSADLVGADLTITAAREAVVDFLLPFNQYDLQLLVNTQFGLGAGVQYLSQDDADLIYLQNSKDATNQAIFANIQAGKPASIVDSDAAGVAKVLAGNYAYVIESPVVAPFLALPANAGKIKVQDGSLGSFYLALAVQQGSPLREKLNLALLQLAEQGVIMNLLKKYNVAG